MAMGMKVRTLAALGAGVVGLSVCASGPAALAQQGGGGTAPAREARSADPRADTMRKMMRAVTVELNEQRLEDVLAFIAQMSGAALDVKWAEDGRDGLDKERLISVKADNATMLTLLERVLVRAQADEFNEATWQLAAAGEMEIGPKSVLNRDAFVKLYDISDLLYVIPSFTEAPRLDLDSVLNQRQGGGAGSIFENVDDGDGDRPSREERAMELIELIVTIVEPEQWIDNGGDAASIRHYNNALLVRAPDYIHRQIDGYPFWRGDAKPKPTYTRYGPGGVERPVVKAAEEEKKQTDVAGEEPGK